MMIIIYYGCRFAVFGLGSSAYPSYCAFSKRVDELLSDIGLKRLMELHTGDEQKNQETAFRNWSNKIYSVRIVFTLLCIYNVHTVNHSEPSIPHQSYSAVKFFPYLEQRKTLKSLPTTQYRCMSCQKEILLWVSFCVSSTIDNYKWKKW